MEQLRRTTALSKSYELPFDETMAVPISQEKFLSSRLNKENLIDILVEKLKTVNIITKVASNDADAFTVETAIEESEKHRAAVIIGEDIDLLVILIGRAKYHEREIFFKKVGKDKIQTKLYSTSSFDHYPRCKEYILFLHAFSGCDTTSPLFWKGKKSLISEFEKSPDLYQLAQVFNEENCALPILYSNGTRLFLAVYNAPKTENNIDKFRYTQFIKSTKSNKPVQLSLLPPISGAALQHINRVYYQIQTWLGRDLEPQEWDWVLQNDTLEPVTTLLAPAPDELLITIFCNCKNVCGSRCGCRKSGMQCSTACGQCNGQSCLNASLDPSDVNEDSEYDPEIFEDMNVGVADTDGFGDGENEEHDTKVISQSEEEDEDEEDDD